MHENSIDATGDEVHDLFYSAHYLNGCLVSPTTVDVDSIEVGCYSAPRQLQPFWTLRRPAALEPGTSWNLEIALPEFMPSHSGSTTFIINTSGLGLLSGRKLMGLFQRGSPPLLIRELDLGILAASCIELADPQGLQILIGSRAPDQGNRRTLSWKLSAGTDTTVTVSDNGGSVFMLDGAGTLAWAATFGEGAGATLAYPVGDGRESVVCTFIQQGFGDADEPRRTRQLWLERDSGRGLAADTLIGLFRPFNGPGWDAGEVLGVFADSTASYLVRSGPDDRDKLKGITLSQNDFAIPLLRVGRQLAFAVSDGVDRISLFNLRSRRLAVAHGSEPLLATRYQNSNRARDRLISFNETGIALISLEGRRGVGWLIWRLRWVLAVAAFVLALATVAVVLELARARRLRQLADLAERQEEKQDQETRQLLSLNQQLDEVILKLQQEFEAQSQVKLELQDQASFLVDIIDSHSDAILVVAGDGTLVQFNRTFAALFQLTREVIAGQSLASSGVELLLDIDRRRQQGALPIDGGYYIYNSQAPKGTFRIQLGRLERSAGHPMLMMISIRNITTLLESRKQRAFRPQNREIIGESSALLDLLQQVEDASDNLSNVLILGESGTGKELIADALHRSSAVAKGPLVKLNCAALSGGVLESELFGHVKGAFTGASADRIGHFEAANGGTLFLDEIGDMDLVMQAKLLRVLENGEFQRVGETVTRRARVRIVAATHQDLQARMDRGEFRRDLFYRLNVLVLKVPALRERRDDIPVLVDHFLARHAEAMKRPIRGVDKEAVALLSAYSWPGNVRELRNVVERAVLSCHEDLVQSCHLPPEVWSRTVVVDQGGSRWDPGESAGRPAASITQSQLAKALDANYWNITATAQHLGISRSSLYNYMREHGLRRPRPQSSGAS